MKAFHQFFREPVIKFKDASDKYSNNKVSWSSGALITKNYVYVVHSSKQIKGALCKLELNEPNLDDIVVLSRNYFVYARNGLIEMNRVNCVKDSHLIKNLARFHSNSAKITDLKFYGEFISLKVWHITR